MAKKTQLGLFLKHKEMKNLKVYLSKPNKYNENTKKCIHAAIMAKYAAVEEEVKQ